MFVFIHLSVVCEPASVLSVSVVAMESGKYTPFLFNATLMSKIGVPQSSESQVPEWNACIDKLSNNEAIQWFLLQRVVVVDVTCYPKSVKLAISRFSRIRVRPYVSGKSEG